MSRPRRALSLELLEVREVPAGVVTARLTGGVLTLTGDAAANGISLRLTTGAAPAVELIPDATTTIDNLAESGRGSIGQPVLLDQYPKSLVVRLGAGADSFALAPGTDFYVRGASIDLGNGANLLDLRPTGGFQINGRLRITAGDGFDDVAVGGEVLASAVVSLGHGGSRMRAEGLSVLAKAGLTIAARDGDDDIEFTDTDVLGRLAINVGKGSGFHVADPTSGQRLTMTDSYAERLSYAAYHGIVDLTRSRAFYSAAFAFEEGGSLDMDAVQIGSLNVTAEDPTAGVDVNVTGTSTFNGPVAVVGGGRATLAVGGSNINLKQVRVAAGTGDAAFHVHDGLIALESDGFDYVGDVQVTSEFGRATATSTTADLRADRLTVFGGIGGAAFAHRAGSRTFLAGAALAVTADGPVAFEADTIDLTVSGSVTVDGSSADMRLAPQSSVRFGSLAVAGRTTFARVQLDGHDFHVSGPTAVSGYKFVEFVADSSLEAAFFGDVRITGGMGVDRVDTGNDVGFERDLTVNLGGGDDVVSLLGAVGRHFRLATGSGTDHATLDGLTVGGWTTLNTGDGADVVTMSWGEFAGPVTMDLGAGDDALRMAHILGMPRPVTFQRRAILRAGAGNDELVLGRTPAAGGDFQSQVRFFIPSSRVEGGTGLNLFDDEAAQYGEFAPGTGVVGWTDPTV